ncbi:hypothetical protein IE81DRAFT_326661 [Ceraceosorus guamensis]|uniref:PPM-type phosphatase domain-containing protein n=1 Tax=Ceraceosorus guamensis TaxID=1522189 RepID=A0A316VPS8_9BASI|nr:hypothetical protein IE81DRAFT_326661 [Ceraceosorus guamensis]PWN39340.1 hypothetical protein IE81DRAFT_326661 [Ceraceosorus guamensis]
MLGAISQRRGHQAVLISRFGRSALRSPSSDRPMSAIHNSGAAGFDLAGGVGHTDARSARPSLAKSMRRSTGSGSSPEQQRRTYRLLPTQTVAIAESVINFSGSPHLLFDGSVITSATEASGAWRQHNKGNGVRLVADVVEDEPGEVQFLRRGDANSSELKGTSHIARTAQEAEDVAGAMLKHLVLSPKPPFLPKSVGRLLVMPVQAPHPSSQRSGVSTQNAKVALQPEARKYSVLLHADRVVHSVGHYGRTQLGPTLLIRPGAASDASLIELHRRGDDEVVAVPIDVLPLANRELPQPTSLGVQAACASEVEALIRQVGSRAAEEALTQLSKAADLEQTRREKLAHFLRELFVMFWRGDAERIAVNLAISADGNVQLDSDVPTVGIEASFDDFSLFRQPDLTEMRSKSEARWSANSPGEASSTTPLDASSARAHELHPLERKAEEAGMVYRKHQGHIGLFGYGAGMGMGTFDGIRVAGGEPANFFDGGGGASAENARAAMEILSMDPDVHVIFVNIFGGITRTDLVAEGIIRAYTELGLKHIPLVVRFRGNMAEEAKQKLRDASDSVPAKLFDDFAQAAEEAVNLARKRREPSASIANGAVNQRRSFSTAASGLATRTSGLARTRAIAQHLCAPPFLSARRSFATSSTAKVETHPRGSFEFLTGYAFAGKPRGPSSSEGEGQEQGSESGEADKAAAASSASAPRLPQQGFVPDSDVGRWRDAMLTGGEAGEDSLTCSNMGSEGGTSDSGGLGLGTRAGDVLLGVADGVGGWSENGVDPALFSQSLMYYATQYASEVLACPNRSPHSVSSSPSESQSQSGPSTPATSPGSDGGLGHAGSPLSILSHAYSKTLKDARVPAGSSTATIVTLDSHRGVLRAANLGDSGFLVLRSSPVSSTIKDAPGQTSMQQGSRKQWGSGTPGLPVVDGVLYASAPLQHGFNTPYQLAKLPPALRQEGSIDSSPKDASLVEGQLRGGDLILLGTDGYFDNVSLVETAQLVNFVRDKHHQSWSARYPPPGTMDQASAVPDSQVKSSSADTPQDELAEEREMVQTVAHNLVQFAIMCMNSTQKQSPFEREAARHGIRYPGGKVDDVALVAALVVER